MENSKSYIFNFTSQEDNPIQFYLMFVLLFFTSLQIRHLTASIFSLIETAGHAFFFYKNGTKMFPQLFLKGIKR